MWRLIPTNIGSSCISTSNFSGNPLPVTEISPKIIIFLPFLKVNKPLETMHLSFTHMFFFVGGCGWWVFRVSFIVKLSNPALQKDWDMIIVVYWFTFEDIDIPTFAKYFQCWSTIKTVSVRVLKSGESSVIWTKFFTFFSLFPVFQFLCGKAL